MADGELVELAGESGCGKSTMGKSLIRLDARMRHVDGAVELDGKELPIGDDAAMNRFRLKGLDHPQYAMSAMNPASAGWWSSCWSRGGAAGRGPRGAAAPPGAGRAGPPRCWTATRSSSRAGCGSAW